MGAAAAWFSVKSVAAVIDALVKVTALAAALLAANFFLFRAQVTHQVTAGQGVAQQIVTDSYREAKEEVPLVVLATMADIHDGRQPARFAYPGELGVPRTDVLCKIFPAQVRSVSGSDRACRNGDSNRAVNNLSRAQVLLLENNDTSFLYRDSKSWAVRTHKQTPTDVSEIFPEAILSPAEIGKAWSRLRIALTDNAVVQVTNTGSADAVDVRIAAPVGWSAGQDAAFVVPAHRTVAREFSSAGAGAVPSTDNFTVSWSSGISPIGGYVAAVVLGLGLLALALGLLGDLRRGPETAKDDPGV